MEIFSTILWHLRKGTKLSFLAHHLVELDKFAPETWCVVGNLFSLQNQHDVALRFFRRALQLDSNCTYAYTLCGGELGWLRHEYMASEDFENAAACFRSAVRTDCRHYNAWYGFGNIYYRQGKYELARYHFQKAIDINPRSSVLWCYLAMVLQVLGHSGDALAASEQAVLMDPKNPLAKFRRASLLAAIGRFEEALSDLDDLQVLAPKESSILLLKGKIQRRLGNESQALKFFNDASDLDPQSQELVRNAIESMEEPDIDALISF